MREAAHQFPPFKDYKEVAMLIKKILLFYPNLRIPEQVIFDLAKMLGEYYAEIHQ